MIETVTGMKVSSSAGICQVQSVTIPDGDVRIYGKPTSYQFKMWCSHDFKTNFGIRIQFPDDFIIIDKSSCIFGGYNTRYYCQIFASKKQIEIRDFTTTLITAATLFTFTVDSIINPANFTDTGKGSIYTIDDKQEVLDTGTWQMPQGLYKSGNITAFSVTPSSTGVGDFPVKYSFKVTPNGDVFRYSYLVIDLPQALYIPDDESRVRRFEDKCGENLFGFSNALISCVVANGGRQIQIKDGFLYADTKNLTDSDGLYFPPELGFTLNGFANPREGGTFGPFNVSIYNKWDKLLYNWQQKEGPSIRVSGISAPSYIEALYETKQNGALTYLEFLVTTTGGLGDGDKIIVKLPFGWQFTRESKVLGRSNNLANTLNSVISVDQRQIEITAKLSFIVQRRLEGEESDFEREELRRM